LIFLFCCFAILVLLVKFFISSSELSLRLRLHVRPHLPIRVVFLEEVAGKYTVHGRVLHVHMQVLTGHGDDDIEVELELMAHAALDREVVGFVAPPPGAELGNGDERAYDDQSNGPLATTRGGGGIRRFRFGCDDGLVWPSLTRGTPPSQTKKAAGWEATDRQDRYDEDGLTKGIKSL
jgi:hypothetical protein